MEIIISNQYAILAALLMYNIKDMDKESLSFRHKQQARKRRNTIVALWMCSGEEMAREISECTDIAFQLLDDSELAITVATHGLIGSVINEEIPYMDWQRATECTNWTASRIQLLDQFGDMSWETN
jgi:hypothetical protein